MLKVIKNYVIQHLFVFVKLDNLWSFKKIFKIRGAHFYDALTSAVLDRGPWKLVKFI